MLFVSKLPAINIRKKKKFCATHIYRKDLKKLNENDALDVDEDDIAGANNKKKLEFTRYKVHRVLVFRFKKVQQLL